MSNLKGTLLKKNKIKYQTVFSTRFDKQVEDDQVLDETELSIHIKINQHLTQYDIGKIDNRSQFKRQIQTQGTIFFLTIQCFSQINDNLFL